MSATEEIRQSIQERLGAIEAEVASLNDALKRLEADGDPPQPARNGRASAKSAAARRPPTERTRPRRPPTPVTAESVTEQLSQANGISAGELADRLGADRIRVLAQLKELEARGDVRRTGERRATRWYVITDEDRIRERAAELERRSRRSAGAASGRR
jgi:hypothetical protein